MFFFFDHGFRCLGLLQTFRILFYMRKHLYKLLTPSLAYKLGSPFRPTCFLFSHCQFLDLIHITLKRGRINDLIHVFPTTTLNVSELVRIPRCLTFPVVNIQGIRPKQPRRDDRFLFNIFHCI